MIGHKVTLNYTADGFIPDPATIRVRKGHTISFHLGTGPAKGKVRITFEDPQFFSKEQFHTGDREIHVTQDLAGPTSYRCELLVNGVVQPNPSKAGGAIEPDTGRASS